MEQVFDNINALWMEFTKTFILIKKEFTLYEERLSSLYVSKLLPTSICSAFNKEFLELKL